MPNRAACVLIWKVPFFCKKSGGKSFHQTSATSNMAPTRSTRSAVSESPAAPSPNLPVEGEKAQRGAFSSGGKRAAAAGAATQDTPTKSQRTKAKAVRKVPATPPTGAKRNKSPRLASVVKKLVLAGDDLDVPRPVSASNFYGNASNPLSCVYALCPSPHSPPIVPKLPSHPCAHAAALCVRHRSTEFLALHICAGKQESSSPFLVEHNGVLMRGQTVREVKELESKVSGGGGCYQTTSLLQQYCRTRCGMLARPKSAECWGRHWNLSLAHTSLSLSHTRTRTHESLSLSHTHEPLTHARTNLSLTHTRTSLSRTHTMQIEEVEESIASFEAKLDLKEAKTAKASKAADKVLATHPGVESWANLPPVNLPPLRGGICMGIETIRFPLGCLQGGSAPPLPACE